MASINSPALGVRQRQAALRRGAKDVLVASGIQPSTRRGNKELTLAVQRLAQQSYGTLDEATQAGQALGQKIVELSQAKDITHLDGGLVRQLMLTGEIPTVPKVTAKISAQAAKTAPRVVIEPQGKAAAPAVTPDDVEPVADATAEAVEVGAAEVGATEVEVPEVDTVDAEVPEVDTGDAVIADAPDLDAIDTLEPAEIEAPDPEPLTAAEAEAAAVVESA